MFGSLTVIENLELFGSSLGQDKAAVKRGIEKTPGPLGRRDLLDLVRSIHADGTTIVLVEQSVNVALSLADRAIFTEKGEVRFDGPAHELKDRADLLRSVFLQGAARRRPADSDPASNDDTCWAGYRALAASRMWTPQADARPITWARPIRAPSIWRSPASLRR